MLIILAVVVALGGAAFFALRPSADVTLVAATRGTAVQVVYATGVIEAEQQANIGAEVSGRIVERYVNEGDEVKLSTPLLRLFDAEQYADVSELIIREVNQEKELQRARELYERRVGSREQFDNAKAELEQTQAKLAAARVRLQQRTVTSPFEGVVLRREHEVGEIVTAGQTLFVIARPQPLRATVEVDEEDFPLVKLGQKVLLSNDAFPGQVFTAAVTELTPLGDASNKTYRVRARLPEGTPLPVGMTLEANIVVAERKNVLLIPSAALRGEQAFRPNGKVVDVKTGIRGLEMTEITEGLAEGDELLAAPPPASGH
jgi:RND family efflux transporter MFP subunit